jgi:hypothetical protein
MGIDIYAEWDGMTDGEKEEQAHSWLSADAGANGYLREAYHGAPYATHVLVPEAFDSADGACIPAATLRERLPETLTTIIERQRVIYQEASDSNDTVAALKSFEEFVELCEGVEEETGTPCRISASY